MAVLVQLLDGKFNRQSLKEVEEAIIDLGLKGIKFMIPYWGNWLPTDPKIYPLYAKIEELGVPALFHQGFVSLPTTSETIKYHPSLATLQNSMPIFLDEVAKDFPDLKIIIAHIGLPWIEDTCLLMQKYANIYADTAWMNYLNNSPDYLPRCLFMAKDYGVADKIIYGTDGPHAGICGGLTNPYGKDRWRDAVAFSNKEYIDLIRFGTNEYAKANNRTPLTETEIQNILGGTIAKLLGIKN